MNAHHNLYYISLLLLLGLSSKLEPIYSEKYDIIATYIRAQIEYRKLAGFRQHNHIRG